ncbi:3-beta-hydroxycholanate 3-dehydrogenase (NAD(+)) 2 [Colletotrichum spaethianum]|uniref:3-beta-hydroxycholanate 3-dehydrogenase (NAD(+)) 2 n=1 Tax=Colletotrichum spaethianum TaxID=700344 RepID=A0AA37P1K5_9PEZI|nr:3-beta-hydroxycholanate 3-dehydrogenase (NAD(+)) 2 [Colletotrichum spaethianum]GKT46895.1 3-beta-hydroxycholanate 3-dehydrogenase (NAD(+)) 2 [Colletotrichum spaethianum]
MSSSQAQPVDLSKKTCLVTGGAGGLGRAIAAAFLAAGSNVVICDNNEERIQKAAAELGGAGRLTAVKTDITDQSQVQELFDKIAENFGTLDILVNNAAIMDRFDPVGDVELDLWDKVMAVNLTAPLLLSKLAVRSMLTKPETSGCIINIASGASKAGWLAGTAYTASKHGLIGLTKSTAAFYGPRGIRCNALMIGIIGGTHLNEAFRNGCHEEGRQKLGEIFSGVKPQPCKVDDVAGICLSLASGPGWNTVNGGLIAVDHGWTSVVG